MQNNDKTSAIKSRLKAIFDIIQNEIEHNDVFRKEIESVILSEDLLIKIKSKKSKPENSINLDMGKIIHESGSEKLIESLDQYTTDQLIKFGIKERAIKSMSVGKKMERNEIITSIVKIAELNSNKGKVFSKSDE